MATGRQVTSKVPFCGPNSTWNTFGQRAEFDVGAVLFGVLGRRLVHRVKVRRADVLGFDRYAVDGVG